MQHFEFAGYNVSRVFKGNWQLAGGHGDVPHEQALHDMLTYVEHGVNVFDVGDIYTGAEELVGEFLQTHKDNPLIANVRVHTKFVPDLNALEDLSEADIRGVIERSLARLGIDTLHLVQFHWWDFAKGDFVKAGQHLEKLRQEGLVEAIGLTNFDVGHTRQLLDAGIPVKSNQIQFSLLDPRPLNGMLEFAKDNGIAIFCYGTLAGGLLAGARPGDEPGNRSHAKYGLMIAEVGEEHYGQVLQTAGEIARRHRTTIANIAAAFVLQTEGVSSVILGPRNAKHINELDQLYTLKLTNHEYSQLRRLVEEARDHLPQDIYSFERDTAGPHGRIMKYNLNGMRPEPR